MTAEELADTHIALAITALRLGSRRTDKLTVGRYITTRLHDMLRCGQDTTDVLFTREIAKLGETTTVHLSAKFGLTGGFVDLVCERLKAAGIVVSEYRRKCGDEQGYSVWQITRHGREFVK